MKKITIALIATITICSTQHDGHAMNRIADWLNNARQVLNHLNLQPVQPIAQPPVQQAVVHQAPVQPSKWQRFKNAAATKFIAAKNFTAAQINRAAGALRLRQPQRAVVQQHIAAQPGRWQHFKNAATTKLIAAKNFAANGSRALLSALRNHPRLTALGISAAVMYLTYRILYLQEPCEIQCMYNHGGLFLPQDYLKRTLLNCYQQCYGDQHGLLGKLIDARVK